MMIKLVDFSYEKRLGGRINFKTSAKNAKGKATKCSLKTTEVLLHVDEHVLI